MPNIANAILGVPSFEREKMKAQRKASEDFTNLPDWAKNWTPEEMRDYVDTQLDTIDSLATAKTVLKQILPRVVWMEGMLRDFMLLKRES